MKKFEIVFEKVCSSTNDIAKELPPYTAVYAERQTNGRGRMGRSWQDGLGNLMTSIVLPKPKQAQLFSFLASLAVAQSIAFLSPRIKWPNDILIDNKKVCGILLETFNDKLIIGIGVNIENHPNGGTLYPTTCLKEHGRAVEAKTLLSEILQNLSFLIECFDKKGFEPIRMDWLEFACGIGQPITVNLPNKSVEGIFSGLNENGALILTNKNQTQFITAGDVFMIDEKKDNNE